MPVLVLALLHKTATLNVDAEAPPPLGTTGGQVDAEAPPFGVNTKTVAKCATICNIYAVYMQYICSI